MRVLFATDGSRSADRARDLLTRLPWPIGTSFCVTSALERRGELVAAPWLIPAPAEIDSVESEPLRHADVTLDDAVRALEGPGRSVERVTLHGRPGAAIVEEATAWQADLVVVGNRGHGPIASMVLGSVSAEVVDDAPCPVLVVRDGAVTSVVLGVDGSPGAARAARTVRTWPILHSLPVAVVAVAETAVPWTAGMVTGLYDEVMTSYAQDVEAARRGMHEIAEEVAGTLVADGIVAVPHVLEGDPAPEIVEFARRRPGSLVVVGTRGHGGLARLVLGSVARDVLLHAAGSVLVVRETVGATGADAATDDETVPAGVA